MRRVRGTKSLVHDAVDQTVNLVALGHESTARTVMRVLAHTGKYAGPAREADRARRLATSAVLRAVKLVNHAVAAGSDAALDVFGPADGAAEALVPLRSDAVRSATVAIDAVVGAVNGFVGDHLASEFNELDLRMALRTVDAWIHPGGAGVPAPATGKIVVLVHGLATTEWSWCLDAERLLGHPDANFGTLLQSDLGYTPVYARYNTGRHISESGRSLAARLADLVAHWPVPLTELVLVGHSMGGLVSRSACHLAAAEGQPWVNHVRRVVTLGSPLRGAPLEDLAHVATALLAAVDLPATVITGRLLRARSAGIKDLRLGYAQDAEWAGRDPDARGGNPLALDLPPHIAWCFIAGTVGSTETHPASRFLGDLLVRVDSATGAGASPANVTVHHVGGIHHAAMQVDPRVYAHVKQFLSPDPEPPGE